MREDGLTVASSSALRMASARMRYSDKVGLGLMAKVASAERRAGTGLELAVIGTQLPLRGGVEVEIASADWTEICHPGASACIL
jgi:hypothetical protein